MRYQKKKKWKYKLCEDTFIKLYNDFGVIKHDMFEINRNELFVRKGYCWDGPSGPAIDTKNFMTPSLVHDVLFQAIRENLMASYKFTDANNELKEQCLERNMSKFRTWYVHKAVEWFGKKNIISDIIEVE